MNGMLVGISYVRAIAGMSDGCISSHLQDAAAGCSPELWHAHATSGSLSQLNPVSSNKCTLHIFVHAEQSGAAALGLEW